MKDTGLTPVEIGLVQSVFRKFAEVDQVILFGSRAKGTQRVESDIDLAIIGVDDPLRILTIADALDELPLPYRFDVMSYSAIKYQPLREHIDRVGKIFYRGTQSAKSTFE